MFAEWIAAEIVVGSAVAGTTVPGLTVVGQPFVLIVDVLTSCFDRLVAVAPSFLRSE